MLDTSDITIEEYKQLAKEFKIKRLPIETPSSTLKKCGINWFKIVKKSCPDNDIIDWLKPRIDNSIKMVRNIGNSKPTFELGDPSDPNILINKSGEFMLIDWDSARFGTTNPEYYIYYTTQLTKFMKPYRDILISHMSNRLNISKSELSDRVFELRRFYEILDVNWAAMMMARVNLDDIDGNIDNFRNIAKQRIKLYEQTFGS